MAKPNYEKLYNDLNKLLSDICEFLDDDIKTDSFSSVIQEKAKILIERSQAQLQKIEKFSYEGIYDGDGENNEHLDDEYDETVVQKIVALENSALCPYRDVAANNLPSQGKKGDLLKKQIRSCFFKKHRKLFGTICETWLLLYNNKKDSKPIECIELVLLQARPYSESIKDKKKREMSFDLIHNNEVSYQFTATTSKDMLQWVTAINKKRITHTPIDTDIVPPPPSKSYMVNKKVPIIDDSQQDALPEYEEVGSFNPPKNYVEMRHPSTLNDVPPELPSRNKSPIVDHFKTNVKHRNLPKTPKSNRESSLLENGNNSEDDIYTNPDEIASSSEDIYDDTCATKYANEAKKVEMQKVDEEDEYDIPAPPKLDSLQKPYIPQKPNSEKISNLIHVFNGTKPRRILKK